MTNKHEANEQIKVKNVANLMSRQSISARYEKIVYKMPLKWIK